MADDELLGAIGSRSKLYKLYRRSNIAHTEEKPQENLPSAEWWDITYAVAPAIKEIDITFAAKLQSWSLLVAQQQELINVLIGTLTTMFCIEAVDPDKGEDDGEADNVSVGSMRIDVAGIESHILDQGSAAGEYCDRLRAIYKPEVGHQGDRDVRHHAG